MIRPALVVAVLAGLAASACTTSTHRSAPASIAAPTTTSASSTSSTSTTTTTASTTTTTTSAVGSATTTTGAPRNLVVTAEIKASLLAAFAASKAAPRSDFTGPEPGTTYYAYLPASDQYWAMASFAAEAGDPTSILVGMQDGGNRGIFHRTGSDAWTVGFGGVPFPCPGALPDYLMTLWDLRVPGGCVVASGVSPAQAALAKHILLNFPSGTYFGALLQFQLNYDGSGEITFAPETWKGSAAPVSHQKDYAVLSFTPQTTIAYSVGASAVSSHQVTGAFDREFATIVDNSMAAFAANAYDGYQVTVANAPGCRSSCGQVTAIEQIGPDTPTSGNPNFTEPPGVS